MEHFIYQRLHTVGGKALHLAEHLTIAARAFEHIYGFRPELDECAIATLIAETLRAVHTPPRIGATVMFRLAPGETSLRGAEGEEAIQIDIDFERRLLDAGYAHSPLRPVAVTHEYSIPFGAFPTGFQLAARALFDTLALTRHGATRSVRREGDRLLSCGDAPLFAVRGRVLTTPPLTDGAMESVERELVMAAAAASRLNVREEPIPHSELKSFDELFFADAAGITSLSECDGAKFMSLAAPRIAAAMR
jgi:hypothetical protein